MNWPFVSSPPIVEMSNLKVDPTVIEQLAELLERTGLAEIELAEGDSRVRVVRQTQAAASPPPATPALAATSPGTTPTAEPEAAEGTVFSPMVGTVYLSPEPGAAPFVAVGSRVAEGQTLLIVEAMKVMNPIRAPRAGTVSAILVPNAAPVEFGEPLLVLS
jgi:acetyl-CoA carboxylase biotin carboxyl carrier protein